MVPEVVPELELAPDLVPEVVPELELVPELVLELVLELVPEVVPELELMLELEVVPELEPTPDPKNLTVASNVRTYPPSAGPVTPLLPSNYTSGSWMRRRRTWDEETMRRQKGRRIPHGSTHLSSTMSPLVRTAGILGTWSAVVYSGRTARTQNECLRSSV
jgi:hypothetical protein